MEQFPHLKFLQKVIGKPRFYGGGGNSPETEQNKEDRPGHGSKLKRWTTSTKSNWKRSYDEREIQGLASLEEEVVPVFFQVNPNLINAEFDLESFGIEIISEEEDGYIIGASLDNLRTLEAKIEGFLASQHGTGKIADFWQIIEGEREVWKPKHILSEQLYSKWNEIQDDEIYSVEVSVAFDKPLGKEPDPSIRGGQRKLEKYWRKQQERDELLMHRETHFEEFIRHYGKVISPIVELEDSFGCEVSISGKGLKDLVVNYQFVFEVSELDEISGINGQESDFPESEIEILPPDEDSIEVGVIDSGIMENHKFIAPAIKREKSRSYIEGEESTADYVRGGGHGTKVAGAILYPNGISGINSSYKLPCFIRNLRVLNDQNTLEHKYPASLMQSIVEDNGDCKIFNLSICSHTPYRTKHMSTWAAVIDKLTFEKDVLFLVAVGNIRYSLISQYLSNRKSYPDYLEEKLCRLANPSQSSFSISVGSINHSLFEDEYWNSLGIENEISAFSRVGTGIWGKIKPDVVEYGGGVVVSKNGLFQIKEKDFTSHELIRSTLHGGSAIGKDSVGTSFSTPKVSYIAAILKQLYPNESVNLIRALIAQGARLPNEHFLNPTKRSIQFFGYGLPSLDRVTRNSDQRITFYNAGQIKAEVGHIYSLQIPENLREQGDEYDILIEVTLAYTAQVRRTRQRTKSYFSTWLDWTASKVGEPLDDFKNYVLKEIEEGQTIYDSEARKQLSNYVWKINNRSDFGVVQDVNRNNSSLQKDWTVLKSYELPEEISLAVRGHKGWDKNKREIPYAITVSIEVLGANVSIYESIRIENEVEIQV